MDISPWEYTAFVINCWGIREVRYRSIVIFWGRESSNSNAMHCEFASKCLLLQLSVLWLFLQATLFFVGIPGWLIRAVKGSWKDLLGCCHRTGWCDFGNAKDSTSSSCMENVITLPLTVQGFDFVHSRLQSCFVVPSSNSSRDSNAGRLQKQRSRIIKSKPLCFGVADVSLNTKFLGNRLT